MSNLTTKRSIQPGEIDAAVAARAVRRIKDYLMRHPDQQAIEVGDEDPLIVPRDAVAMLAYILAEAADGRGISIIPSHAELTTQQAADMLNVSRPYLIKLLESGEIDFRTVGTHRRVTAQALMEYKRHDGLKRRAAADELAGLSQELDLP